MTVPKYFRKTGERAISSFDYLDIVDGTGMVEFDLAVTSYGNKQILTTQSTQIYSSLIETADIYDSTPTSDSTKSMDEDFDLTAFTTPRNIKGTGLMSFTWKTSNDGTGTKYTDTYINVIVKRVSGATETTVGTGRTALERTAAGGSSRQTETIYLTLTDTHFAAGDILRVTVESWTSREGGIELYPNQTTVIAHDPQNRDGTIIKPSTDTAPVSITKTKIWIPFKIDL